MARVPKNPLTVKAPRKMRKFAMPKGSRPSMLREPGEDGWQNSYFGRAPYVGANAGLWASGGNVVFSPRTTSANRDILKYRDRGVANAREADRNSPLINAGLDFRAINTVGANLRLQYLPNWDVMGVDPDSEEAVQFVQDVENQFSLWAEDHRLLCDAQRQGQFGALMLLSCRECMGADGETLVVARYDEDRMNKYNGRFATFVEVVSCDRLSTPATYVDGRGPKIVAGKELDEYGAAVAFHVETTHRDDDTTGDRTWARILRETDYGRPVGIHFFFRARAGMQRNMPAIIQSLRNVKMLDRYDDVALEKAVLASLVSIFVESPATSEEILLKLTTQTPDSANNPLMELWDKRFGVYDELALSADGVRIPVLAPGDKINMASAKDAAPDDGTFRKAFQRTMARQLHLTYEQFSGDYSDTTFSSARAAIIDSWRLVTVDRILFSQHVPLLCFAAFLEELWVRGDEIDFQWPAAFPDFYENQIAYCQSEFRGPGMGWVDPQKDVNAAGLRVEQVISSPTREAALQGEDFRDVVDQTARDRKYAKMKGVPLPGTPEFAAASAPPPPPQPAGAQDPGADPGSADSSNDAPGAQPPADSTAAAAQELDRQENRQ